MDELLQYLISHVELTKEEISFLTAHAELRSVPKNHVLLEEGQVSTAFFFISRGAVRLFYRVNEEEKTAYFYTEGMFVSSYRSFTKQLPAAHGLATIEASELVVFDQVSAMKLMEFSHKFEMLARIMMEEELAANQDIISAFVTQNAEERYQNLLKNRPELLERIPQYHIATYLGVSPETLSRIRKRIMDK